MKTREQELMETYPQIAWRAPQRAIVGSKQGFICRFCVAMIGLKGTELDRIQPRKVIERHIAEEHLAECAS